MGRIMRMPDPNAPKICPSCGTQKIHKLERLTLVSSGDKDLISNRYRCNNGHVFIRTDERRAAASGE